MCVLYRKKLLNLPIWPFETQTSTVFKNKNKISLHLVDNSKIKMCLMIIKETMEIIPEVSSLMILYHIFKLIVIALPVLLY